MNESLKTWADYYSANSEKVVTPMLDEALKYVDEFNLAVDVGSGDFTDSNYLAAKFQKVVAIDPAKVAKQFSAIKAAPNIIFHNQKIEDVRLSEGIDFISAQVSLQYVPKDRIEDVIARILTALKSGGIFVASIVGDRDSWNSYQKMSTLSRAQISGLLSDFDVIGLSEIEEDKNTRLGTPKHWHLFRIIAKKK